MMKSNKRVIDLDIRGQVCPATLLVVMAALNKNKAELLSGEALLCIKTDNREATATIPTTSSNMGYEVKVTKTDTYYHLCIGVPSSERK